MLTLNIPDFDFVAYRLKGSSVWQISHLKPRGSPSSVFRKLPARHKRAYAWLQQSGPCKINAQWIYKQRTKLTAPFHSPLYTCPEEPHPMGLLTSNSISRLLNTMSAILLSSCDFIVREIVLAAFRRKVSSGRWSSLSGKFWVCWFYLVGSRVKHECSQRVPTFRTTTTSSSYLRFFPSRSCITSTIRSSFSNNFCKCDARSFWSASRAHAICSSKPSVSKYVSICDGVKWWLYKKSGKKALHKACEILLLSCSRNSWPNHRPYWRARDTTRILSRQESGWDSWPIGKLLITTVPVCVFDADWRGYIRFYVLDLHLHGVQRNHFIACTIDHRLYGFAFMGQ